MITPKNLVRHELIGLPVEVVDSTNKELIGLKGKVIDETRNTLTVGTASGDKKLVKDQSTFRFRIPSGEKVRVKGEILVARPEDRIKKKFDKW